MLAAEISQIPAEIRVEVMGHFEDLSSWLTKSLEAGVRARQFRLKSPARIEALALMAAVHGAMLSARAFGDPEVFSVIVQAAYARIDVTHARPAAS
jgi:TetR/AcrR family transcriptional repressor of nem operon